MATASDARAELIGLTRVATEELASVLADFRSSDAAAVRDVLLEALPALGGEYELAAATLAADFYDDDRPATRSRFQARPATPADLVRWSSLAGWSVGALFAAAPDFDLATSRVLGGTQRTIADAHRSTVVENVARDPRAQGWRRVGDGSSCGFCNMLISRGDVYKDATVTFKSHDDCGCMGAPAWSDGPTVSPLAYKASARNVTNNDRALVREYIRTH